MYFKTNLPLAMDVSDVQTKYAKTSAAAGSIRAIAHQTGLI